MFLLLCLLNVLHILLKFNQLFKNTTQISSLRLDSCEWQDVWDRMEKYQGQRAPLVFWIFIHEQVQNPKKLLKYLEKLCCEPVNSRGTQITGTPCARAWCMSFEPCALPSEGGEGLGI